MRNGAARHVRFGLLLLLTPLHGCSAGGLRPAHRPQTHGELVEVLRHMLWPELWAHSGEDDRLAAAPAADGRESATEDGRGDAAAATAAGSEQAQQQRAARLAALAAAINAVAERVNYGGAAVRRVDYYAVSRFPG